MPSSKWEPTRRSRALTQQHSRIGEVADELNLPVATIRVWERRYGLPESVRTEGGHRRFGPDEVRQLSWMLAEVSKGRPPREAAALLHRQEADRRRPAYGFVRALLERHGDAKQADARRVLDAAAERFGPSRAIATVVAWTVRELADPCAAPPAGLTQVLRRWLDDVRCRGDRGDIVLARMDATGRSLRLDVLAGLARANGWTTQHLEPVSPAAGIVRPQRAAEHSSALVFDAATGAGRLHAMRVLRGAARNTDAELFFTGTAFLSPTSRRHVPGTYLDDDPAVAADAFLRSLRG
jgi:MerR family transcriptional regulator, light-induced transcriptional regulator